jgi:hypothetical protein
MNMSFSARTQMIAALAVSAVLIGSTASWGSQVYVETRASAQQQTQQVLSAGKEQITALTERSADLELAISNATTILNDSSGKVLDENARQVLEKSISTAQAALAANKKTVAKLKTQLKSLSTSDVWEEFLPTLKRDRAENSITINKKDVETLANNVIALGQGIQAVQATQAAWQAEQDRIAAEKAAAEAAAAAQAAAAARRAAQAKTLEQTGGSTTPTAPAPPVTAAAAAPVTQGFSAEAYIAALAPNAYVVWDNGMCARQFGPNVYLCGFATVNLAGSNTDRVPITLDSSLTERYSNSVGVSVLVHEAAHARQWWKYGPSIMTAYNALVPGQTGSMPVEWMADCATIVKLGYSTGAYTRSCTAEQLAEAATLW